VSGIVVVEVIDAMEQCGGNAGDELVVPNRPCSYFGLSQGDERPSDLKQNKGLV